MKKIAFLFLAIVFAISGFAQSDVLKRKSIGIHYSMFDYKSGFDVRNNSLATVINNKQFFKFKRMDPALSISYLEGITNNIDFVGTLSGGFLKHPTSTSVSNPSGNDQFILEAAATANFKLLSDNYIVSPFFTAGIGATKWGGYYSAFIPVGIGMQVKVANGTFLLLNSQYRMPVTEKSAYHFYHSIGFASAVGKSKVANVAPVPVVPAAAVVADKDGDGVVDADDKCPDVAGLASLNGCADKDSDGIADNDDKCPDVAGLSKYGGCPIPDTDSDGINDEEDKCINVKGFARYQGCPIPDTDADGVNDEEDKCIDRTGTAANQGCPEIAKAVIDKINYVAKNVFFATGSAKLLPKSFKALDEAAKLLKEDESLMVDVDGHTDATGKEDKNQILSESRAAAVKTYLVSKGVADSRLTATGFGSTKPVADNKTAAGKAKNRRTELAVRNF
ncbi:MAG: OmpA family protein [Ferruginibacter sp.]|nr:OmpA family protein [Ferruginibacter sp.]